MRDYLYLWHDPEQRFLIASGLELRDFLPFLARHQGGILLLQHQSETPFYDFDSGFEYVPVTNFRNLETEDIDAWGNAVWVDYGPSSEFPSLADDDIAALLFFSHRTKPLHGIAVPGLNNVFLAFAHDDGWFLRLYYTDWERLAAFVTEVIPPALGTLDVAELKQGHHAFWLWKGTTCQVEKTEDIDRLLSERL